MVNALVVGVEQGGIYSLVALGLVTVYSATNVFNFAHGDLVMASTVLTVVLWRSFGVPIVLAGAASVVGVVVLGALTERIAVRPVLGHDTSTGWILSTFGVSIIVSTSFTIALTNGTSPSTQRFFPSYLPFHGWSLGGVLLDPNKLFVVVVAAIVAVLLVVFLRRTNYGRALRAVADDREGAAMRGVPVARISLLSFVIGAAIAGVTGVVVGPVTQADAGSGAALVLKGFIAAAVGGIPSIEGALVGGVVLGMIESFIQQFTNGKLIDPISLAALLLVLSIRPNGLMGQRGRIV